MFGSAAPSARSSQLRALLLGWLALGAIAFCHSPVLRFGFLDWDDGEHVTKNRAVLEPAGASLREQLLTPALGYPIPVTQASYALEARLFGLAAWHFHLLNAALQLWNCGLVFGLARRMGIGQLGALCALLLFGLHPVVAEPVSWVTGRKDLLACGFGLGSLWLAWPPGSPLLRAASVGCYAFGLLSKPTLAPLCLLAPLARCLFECSESAAPRRAARELLRAALPYLIVLAPIAALGFLGQHDAGAIADASRENAGYARAAWYALGHHLRLLFGLEEPTAKYLPRPWPPGFAPSVDLLPLLAAAVSGLVGSLLRGALRRAFVFGLIWAGLCYLPNSNLIPLARYLADSYVYLPLAGVAWCAGACADGLAQALRRSKLRALQFALPLLIALACLPALGRSQRRFADDAALWAHALRRYPHPRICRMWANGIANTRGPGPGLEATESCMREFGDGLFARNKGLLLVKLGRFDEARTWFERAQRDVTRAAPRR